MRDLLLKKNRGEAIHSTSNSKEVKEESIFFCLKGKTADGHNFIGMAIKQGASFIFYSEVEAIKGFEAAEVNFIYNKNLKEELPYILKQLYDVPSKIIAVTGTNGKTSVCFLGMQLFGRIYKKAGYIGTTGVYLCENGALEMLSESPLTTPDIITLFGLLAEFKQRGVEHIFFEASSIGLEQERIAGLALVCGCFTNFTQDHLDYHHTMEEYFNKKALLFNKFLPTGSFAALNKMDEKIASVIPSICKQRGITVYDFGNENASVFASNINITPEYIEFDTNYFKGAKVNLAGEFQLQNILCVLAICLGFKIDLTAIQQFLPLLKAPRGRLERVETTKKDVPLIFVDYAHTPDSLLKAMETLKKIKNPNGKLLVLFGCGGDRDASKRKIMGKIASKIADFVVITDDNPRTENPTKIRQDIISGIVGKKFKEIEGRGEAIEYIISIGSKNDIILLAGKGHENYQIIGTTKLHFDDYECSYNCLVSNENVDF